MPENLPGVAEAVIESLKAEIAKTEPTKKRRVFESFVLAALSSLPWVGGFLSAAATFKFDEATLKTHSLQNQWLEEHHRRLLELQATLEEIGQRFEKLGDTIDERIQSDEYLGIVRKAFRAWDQADTKEKRRYVANLITHAAGTRICSDDILRLFIDWLELYHEAHFAVIREIHQNPGSTRFEIWTATYGAAPREDSAEADLYKMLIRDLSTGGVIRQERDVNQLGQFVRKRPLRVRRGGAAPTMKSAFDDSENYVLTELGKQFVHYTMNELVDRLMDPAGT
ncbi:MAG TPA: hypothetical protein VHU89_02730 [Acidobacteriaceae bacterium]|jgi:hypothetical protein|nr:hypothetical protein [Acidobacteriaceae bacterium]